MSTCQFAWTFRPRERDKLSQDLELSLSKRELLTKTRLSVDVHVCIRKCTYLYAVAPVFYLQLSLSGFSSGNYGIGKMKGNVSCC